MKLGLLTDIHEHTVHLRTALEQLRQAGVDQVVVLGDVFQVGQQIRETAELLLEADVIGVWGNHDFGVCHLPPTEVEKRSGKPVLDLMAKLKPRLEIEGCLFTHVEPWLNPEDVCDLWYYEGPPDSPEKVARIFAAVPHRLMFAGHYHRWMAVTPEGILEWHGAATLQLTPGQRFLVVVGALCEGRYATFDTESLELVPFNEAAAGEAAPPQA